MGLNRPKTGRDSFHSSQGNTRLRVDERGFTLIEMLMVISISALLLGVLVSDFSSTFNRIRLSAATRDIASGLRQCRNASIISGRPNRFELDIANHAYRPHTKSQWIQLSDAIDLSLYTTAEETIDETMGGIRFFPDGSSSGGRITLVDHQLIYHVDINWLTSEIRIHRPSS